MKPLQNSKSKSHVLNLNRKNQPKKPAKKHHAEQLKLGKQFNHGGARKGSGRKSQGGTRKTFAINMTTLAMIEAVKSSEGLTHDQVLSAAMIALADLKAAGGIQAVLKRERLTRDDIARFPGN